MHNDIRPETSITIARVNGETTFRFEQRVRIPCDGDWHRAEGANDEEGQGRCDFSRGQLQYSERFDDARTHHALGLSEDGQTLRMAVRISHPRLPDDLHYRLTYRRR